GPSTADSLLEGAPVVAHEAEPLAPHRLQADRCTEVRQLGAQSADCRVHVCPVAEVVGVPGDLRELLEGGYLAGTPEEIAEHVHLERGEGYLPRTEGQRQTVLTQP